MLRDYRSCGVECVGGRGGTHAFTLFLAFDVFICSVIGVKRVHRHGCGYDVPRCI